MKKSIIYLGVALITTANVSLASNTSFCVNNLENIKNYDDISPLNIAISKGDIVSVKKFLDYGSDVNEKSNGLTPLMYAARYNKVEIIKLLLSKGARLNEKDEKGFTALKHAEISNATEAAQFLKQQ
ncbi:ankyrin repeat domain-containing protein [Flavobacterium adhaerens]|uniref:ankyrin repeat domain-containing protein n=1 Tax=Flavobacterium adhaerens TaxID=3149043 RepID=UPI0032B32550